MKKAFANTAINKRQRYSWHEKASIVYVLGMFIMFLLAPLVKIDQINSTSSEMFGLLNQAMTKTSVIILLCGLFLIWWNSSYRWKQRLHRTFWYNGTTSLTNAVVLFIILLMLFTMGDTVGLIRDNFSPRIWATNRFLIVWIYLIAGIAWQLAVTRINWKKQLKSDTVTIKQEIDESKKERDFQQMEKEFQGLFEGEWQVSEK